MISERTDRIKNIIEESGSFALLLNENAKEHELLARKTLKAALRSKGKSVRVFPEAPDEFKKRWSAILPPAKNGSFVHSGAIRIPKEKLNIKEISYENGGDFFVINIKSENGRLERENVSIESGPAEIDAVFSIGPADAEYMSKLKEKISLPPEDKIIPINPNGAALAEKTRDIIKNIDEELLSRDNIPTLLLAALLLERISRCEQSMGKAAELERDLLRLGADKKFVNGIMMEFLSLDRLPVV